MTAETAPSTNDSPPAPLTWDILPELPISLREARLETPRLILREYCPDDADAVMQYAADPEVLRYREAQPATRQQVVDSLARIEAQRWQEPQRLRYELAIVTRTDNHAIGWLPLLLSGQPELNDAEIGWTLAREAWGLGYATEAAQAALAFAFEKLRLHRVWARCVPENTASSRVMEKIGMRFEGRFRQTRFVKGRWIDLSYYAILEEEWWRLQRDSMRLNPENR